MRFLGTLAVSVELAPQLRSKRRVAYHLSHLHIAKYTYQYLVQISFTLIAKGSSIVAHACSQTHHRNIHRRSYCSIAITWDNIVHLHAGAFGCGLELLSKAPHSTAKSMFRTIATATAIVLALAGLHMAFNSITSPYQTLANPASTQMSTSPPYKAPVTNPDIPPAEKVPGSYVFYMRQGHSIEDHKATVRHVVDLDQHIRRIFTDMPPGRQTMYSAHDISEAALDAIRADYAIRMVECDVKVHVPEEH